MLKGIDHIVILVRDLAQAQADYAALGFTVVPGGEHTGGATHNALVAFADGSYLELIAFKRDDPDHRWWERHTQGGGLVDFALWPGDIAADLAAANERGAGYAGPVPGGRLRPDGLQVDWQLGLPPSPDLPFMCYDVTPRDRRVPSGATTQHANGALGVGRVTVAVRDLGESVTRYQALLGTAPHGGQDSTPMFQVGRVGIELVAPDFSSDVEEYLEERGDGPFALELRTSVAHTPPSRRERTHGVRLHWVAE